ncbi:hypothetical protein BROUX41_002219 [Berkeleyomyces rouxiae]|uniref:uncharacterized protein n=1 Tax=Berkeleyomyces rouxiae TaxID=2035830 RepID=UPI003B79B418
MASKRVPKGLVKARINTLLLACHIILMLAETQNDVLRALVKADQALQVGTIFSLPGMQAKAYLYRGHCFRALTMWTEAQHCYRRAIEYSAAEVEGLARKCLSNMALEREAMVQHQIQRRNTFKEGRPGDNADESSRVAVFVDEEEYLLQRVRDVGRAPVADEKQTRTDENSEYDTEEDEGERIRQQPPWRGHTLVRASGQITAR